MARKTHAQNAKSAEPTRRDFLKGATSVAAGMMAAPLAKAESPTLLPAVPLGSNRVTRMIVGSNPIYGYSHFNHQYDLHMMEYFTDERLVQFLLDCEKAGINTWQASYHDRMGEQFPKIRGAGCKIQWICLAASWHYDRRYARTPEAITEGTIKCAEAAAQFKPIGIAHHGGATDLLWRAGKIDMVKSFVDRVHDLGIAAGISTHNPEILDALEAKGFNNDFYMTSLHYLTRRDDDWKKEIGVVPVGETYLSTDPPKMCEAARRAKKTCLVYKVLAAGRRCGSPQEVRAAFEFAYKNIKSTDGAIIGLYPKFYPDQVAEDTRMIREILA